MAETEISPLRPSHKRGTHAILSSDEDQPNVSRLLPRPVPAPIPLIYERPVAKSRSLHNQPSSRVLKPRHFPASLPSSSRTRTIFDGVLIPPLDKSYWRSGSSGQDASSGVSPPQSESEAEIEPQLAPEKRRRIESSTAENIGESEVSHGPSAARQTVPNASSEMRVLRRRKPQQQVLPLSDRDYTGREEESMGSEFEADNESEEGRISNAKIGTRKRDRKRTGRSSKQLYLQS